MDKEKKETSHALKRNHLLGLYKQHLSKMNICCVIVRFGLNSISKQLWIYIMYFNIFMKQNSNGKYASIVGIFENLPIKRHYQNSHF